MFKLRRIVGVLCAAAILSGSVSIMGRAEGEKKQHNLNKGIVMLTPSGGRGFERFYPTLKDKVIQDHAFFPFGWSTVEPEEGVYDWSEVDELIKQSKLHNKKFAIAFWSAAHSYEQAPQWLFYKYNIRRLTSKGAFINFESKKHYRGFEILSAGTLTKNADEVVSEQTSLIGYKGAFLTSGEAEINKGFNNSLGFDYKVLEGGKFSVVLNNKDGSSKKLWEEDIQAGKLSSKMIKVTKEELSNYKSIVWVAETGKISIDNVTISAEIPGEQGVPVAYPNYFDPLFKVKYENFLAAFYEKYKDEPTLAAIYVGGYGRWDEVTLGADNLNPTEDNEILFEQWKSYGYTDEKYIDHVKWCGDITEEYFGKTDKNIIMQSIAFDVPGDTSYVNWKVINYAAQKNFGVKVNGLTEKCSEWDGDANQYYWIANRYKHTDTQFYLEEAIQVNNALSHIMGHPLNVVNRLIIDSIDYYWFYDIDISDPYVRKYLHYANEQAGSALVNKMYSIMGAFPYYSNHAKKNFTHYNLWTGIFTKNSNKLEFGELDGTTYAQTTGAAPAIIMSVDDRQKWSGMFGNTITVDFYDSGTDKFAVEVYVPDGSAIQGEPKVLGTVTKTNTNSWKTVSFYNSEFVNDKRSGGFDMPVEISIDDMGDGTEMISRVELNYVPVGEYKENIIQDNKPVIENKIDLTREPISFDMTIPEGKRLSKIAVPVTEVSGKKVNVAGKVYVTTTEGKETLLTEKNLFMPGDLCYLPMPVSNAPSNAVKFRVELSVTQGKAAAFNDQNGNIANKTFEFVSAESQPEEIVKLKNEQVILETLKDFYGLKIKGNGKVALSITKRMPDGRWVKDLFSHTLAVNGETQWCFEPQTSGVYRVEIKEGKGQYEISPIPLTRIDAPKEPLRYNMGKTVNTEFLKYGDKLWKPVSGFKDMKYKDGIFSALLDGKDTVIDTGVELNIKAGRLNTFHLVMKNETSSPLTKIYWKTTDQDYCEANSTIIPTVANDAEFREYSWPIGMEATWKGTITGLRVMPVSGHTETGKISIYSMELRDDNAVDYEFREPLKLSEVRSTVPVKVEKNKSDGFTSVLKVAAGTVIALIAGVFVFLVRRKKVKA